MSKVKLSFSNILNEKDESVNFEFVTNYIISDTKKYDTYHSNDVLYKKIQELSEIEYKKAISFLKKFGISLSYNKLFDEYTIKKQ